MGIAQSKAQPKKLLKKTGKHFVNWKAHCAVL
jgi:hypothetical protein